MASRKIYRAALVMVLIAAGWGAHPRGVLAQDGQQPRIKADEAAGLEVQLHILVARKTSDGEDEKLPAALDPVIKQLKATFTFKSYRLATTLLNRVRNGGRLGVRWVGSPLLATPAAAAGGASGSNDFNVMQVKLEKDDAGRDVVQMYGFSFGARIILPAPSVASAGGGAPAIQSENPGISTDISVREGEPTIVGTLNVGPAGDALIVVVTAKKPGKEK
ncbi:MAG TPA: hypothetical protein VD861_11730 [Pyrinomonadaceae bacterium]|nr:hypothetical protein [Pyrinomonadaceae bacterium]